MDLLCCQASAWHSSTCIVQGSLRELLTVLLIQASSAGIFWQVYLAEDSRELDELNACDALLDDDGNAHKL